jgi:Family of unknown function (DUF6920)
MALWARLVLGGLALAVAGFVAAVWFGSFRWNDQTAQRVQQLIQSIPPTEGEKVSFENFDRLPVPVARYFRRTLKEGRPLIRSARVIEEGEFRARNADDGWGPFIATQFISAAPPGFVWDARIRMVPMMTVRVRDAYISGQGSMQAKILSVFPVVDERDKAELNTAALQRYLAEAVWIPTSLLPGHGIQWTAVDNHTARATLTDSGITASVEFRFNDADEVTSVFSPGRYREVNGKYGLTPWEGHFRRYEVREGMRIPIEGAVEWHLPDGSFPYWRGRLIGAEYEFGPK